MKKLDILCIVSSLENTLKMKFRLDCGCLSFRQIYGSFQCLTNVLFPVSSFTIWNICMKRHRYIYTKLKVIYYASPAVLVLELSALDVSEKIYNGL